MRCTTYLIIILYTTFLHFGCKSKSTFSRSFDYDYKKVQVIPNVKNLNFHTSGGRGGAVFIISNLLDSGKGSLRNALESEGPRMILFSVSGEIFLNSAIVVSDPYVSLYGQTSPNAGIILRNAGLSIRTHDIVIQDIAVYPGDNLEGSAPAVRDGIEILGPQSGSDEIYNIIIDHCSVSFAVDENVSIWGNVRDVLITNSIISYALVYSLHPKGEHSMGMLIGPGAKNITVCRNVFAFNKERNPRIRENTKVNFSNNLVFGCNSGLFAMDSNEDNENFFELEMTNNVFIPEVDEYSVRVRQVNPRSILNQVGNYKDTNFEKKIFKRNPKQNRYEISNSIMPRDKVIKYAMKNVGSHRDNRNIADKELLKRIARGDAKGGLVDALQPKLIWARGLIIDKKRSTLRFSNMKSLIKKFRLGVFVFECNGKSTGVTNMTDKFIVVEHDIVGERFPVSFKITTEVDRYKELNKVASWTREIKPPVNLFGDDDRNGYSNLEDWLFLNFGS